MVAGYEVRAALQHLLGRILTTVLYFEQTTAHTLAYAFILLALYPEEQEAFYRNIKTVLPSGRVPVCASFLSVLVIGINGKWYRHTTTSARYPTR